MTEDQKCYSWETYRIPEACLGVDVVVGVDEAGRGPVLGSLVYTAAFWPASEDEEISRMGFNDSKQLKEGERDKLLDRIRSHPSIGWVIEEISPVDISSQMLRANPVSLNALSYEAVIRILRKIVSTSKNPPKVTTVFVDTVGDPEYYKSKLINGLGETYGEFVIEKKADAKFKVVSAASIIAKVTRDTALDNWRWAEHGVDYDKNFGSGYPGDETCVKWLERSQHPLFGYPNIVRFSWSTTRDILEKKGAHAVHWECDEEETGSQSVTSYFQSASNKASKKPRTGYFTKRKLTRLTFDTIA